MMESTAFVSCWILLCVSYYRKNLTCVGKQCPSLASPLNGEIVGTCNNLTGSSCRFSCNRGYTLRGSSLRFCSPASTWTGRRVMCEPLRCEQLDPPENGAILPPCINEFSSTCTILCNFGFVQEGMNRQTCGLNSEGSTEWSEAPICIGNDFCML